MKVMNMNNVSDWMMIGMNVNNISDDDYIDRELLLK